MFSGERITILIIPEVGGKTYELKLPRLLVGVAGAAGVVIVLLLLMGLHYFVQAGSRGVRVARLEREKALLEGEVRQIEQLETVLRQLQRSNDQLRAILSESDAPPRLPGATGRAPDELPGAMGVLRDAGLRAFPALWPADGVIARPFSPQHPAVTIAVPEGSLVRAAAPGRVEEAGYDDELGYRVRVNHGRGLVTVYGYARRLMVEEGEHVDRGQPLALSGRTGTAVESSLYYAVRRGGRAVDPVEYRLWL